MNWLSMCQLLWVNGSVMHFYWTVHGELKMPTAENELSCLQDQQIDGLPSYIHIEQNDFLYRK